MDKYGESTYNLYEIQDLIKNPDTRVITRRCRTEASSLGYINDSEIISRVLHLKKSEIYKTMPAERCPGLWQDVYRTNDGSTELYIKLQKSYDDKKGIIIQFKER